MNYRGRVLRKRQVMGLIYTVPGRPKLGHHGPWAPHSVREANEREEGVQERVQWGLETYLCLV